MTTREKFAFTGVNYDEMVNDIASLLSKYHWEHSKAGIEKMLDEYMSRKKGLLEQMVNSPNYNGNLQIVTSDSFDTNIDIRIIRDICNRFLDAINAKKKIITNKDESGKTFTDYLVDSVSNLPTKIKLNALSTMTKITSISDCPFDRDGSYSPSVIKYNKLVNIVRRFKEYGSSILDDEMALYLNSELPKIVDENGKVISHGIKAVAGQKTSRAFNKVFAMFGFENDKEYLKKFPEYADCVTERRLNRIVVISAHPIDYLTMSFGNTWASCHTIDKRNERHMDNNYSGMYCGGTLSYMQDEVSLVVYCPTPFENNHPERANKIYRNMIYFQNGILIQSRVYPQSNDGSLDLYKKFRGIEQREISKMLGIEHITGNTGNDTWIKKGASCDSNGSVYRSEGVHYPDYNYRNMGGVVSYIRNTDLSHRMTIGHAGICPKCGQEVLRDAYLTHSSCIAATDNN